MAPRRDQDLEIFTDLNGTPEKTVGADVELLTDDKLRKADEDEDDDEDLEIADETDGADGDDTEVGEEEEAEEEAESADAAGDETAQADPEILFNPADVQVIIAESNNLELRENAEKAALERAKTDAADAKAAMEKAMEDGDSKAHGNAAEKFADAKGAYQTASARLENITSEKNALKGRAQAVIAKAPKNDKGEAIVDKIVFVKPAGGTKTPAKSAGSKLMGDFLKQNPWFNDPAKKSLREKLLGIDRALAADGKLDKNSKEYFAELGKQFNKLHPGVYKNLDGKLVATGQRQRGAGPGVPGSGGGGGGGGGSQQPAVKIRLTSEDVAQMRIFNLDPDDKKVRRSWLNEKIATANADAKRKRAA